MRLVDLPIKVALREGQPTSFRWRGQTYRIARIIDRWRYMGRWWVGEGEWRFWRVPFADAQPHGRLGDGGDLFAPAG